MPSNYLSTFLLPYTESHSEKEKHITCFSCLHSICYNLKTIHQIFILYLVCFKYLI